MSGGSLLKPPGTNLSQSFVLEGKPNGMRAWQCDCQREPLSPCQHASSKHIPPSQETEEGDADALEDDTASEETGSEVRDDQTDTSSAEVPSARPRRAVTLRSSSEAVKRPPVERARRVRPVPTAMPADEGDKGPPARPEEPEVSSENGGSVAHF